MKKLRQSLGYLIAGILLFFLIKPFVATHSHLKGVIFDIQWGWLVCSFGTILFYWSSYLCPFAVLMSGISQKRISFFDAWTLFHLANITRYLPGRIWGIMRILSLSHRFGVSKTAVGSSLTLHVGIETALAGLLGMSLLFSKHTRQTATEVLEKLSTHTMVLTLIVIGLMAGILFCLPKLAHHARAFFKILTPVVKNTRLWMNVLVSHSLLWICQGFAFFLFVKSLTPVLWTDAGVLAACFAFAWIVGFLSFLTPGGLGVREGLLGLLLANYMPTPQATLIALLCRLWMLSAEMVLAGMAFLFHRKSVCPKST